MMMTAYCRLVKNKLIPLVSIFTNQIVCPRPIHVNLICFCWRLFGIPPLANDAFMQQTNGHDDKNANNIYFCQREEVFNEWQLFHLLTDVTFPHVQRSPVLPPLNLIGSKKLAIIDVGLDRMGYLNPRYFCSKLFFNPNLLFSNLISFVCTRACRFCRFECKVYFRHQTEEMGKVCGPFANNLTCNFCVLFVGTQTFPVFRKKQKNIRGGYDAELFSQNLSQIRFYVDR